MMPGKYSLSLVGCRMLAASNPTPTLCHALALVSTVARLGPECCSTLMEGTAPQCLGLLLGHRAAGVRSGACNALGQIFRWPATCHACCCLPLPSGPDLR